ncbi:ATP-grasp domain-containing protein [Legionella cardiaca]|uniref:ATP-grasp domain-containing protein n=1 Tax=Legionella cardiaca TaxID=1071983 RepID=A0ABY8ASP7_9GAMM|nr:hypothetical protein [Legionella cardiaca]WED43700.1 hypothetical protein PXX05_02680 [Legionella cardiaca]
MTVYVFLYNVVAIKSNLSHLKGDSDCQFILIGSEYCLNHLSDENKSLFNEIYRLNNRSFHQINSDEVELILLDILNRFNPQDIRLLSNEDSTQLVCALLREKYSIPGYQSSQVLPYVNKVVSKHKLARKVRIPHFISFDKNAYKSNNEAYLNTVVNKIGFPMFIKPIDLVSSIDTYHVTDMANLRKVLKIISQKSWDFEIDEFIEGDLYHCDAILRENTIEFFMAGKYAWPLAKFSKGSPMGSFPINDASLFSELKEFTDNVLNALGTFSSAFHIEVFKSKKSGELIFLEAAARTPGAGVPDMYKIIYGKHLEELHYQVQMHPERKLNVEHSETYAGWITFPKIKGTLVGIKQPNIPINNTLSSFVKMGDKLEQAVSLLDSSCSIVFWDECYHKAKETFEYLRFYEPLIVHETE